jgi:hypothetical protein
MIFPRHDGMAAADIDERRSVVAKPAIPSLPAMTASPIPILPHAGVFLMAP